MRCISELAKRLGGQQFTSEGRTQEERMRHLYEQSVNPFLVPAHLEEFRKHLQTKHLKATMSPIASAKIRSANWQRYRKIEILFTGVSGYRCHRSCRRHFDDPLPIHTLCS